MDSFLRKIKNIGLPCCYKLTTDWSGTSSLYYWWLGLSMWYLRDRCHMLWVTSHF